MSTHCLTSQELDALALEYKTEAIVAKDDLTSAAFVKAMEMLKAKRDVHVAQHGQRRRHGARTVRFIEERGTARLKPSMFDDQRYDFTVAGLKEAFMRAVLSNR